MVRDPDALVARAITGDRGAIAKLISMVESGGADATAAGAALYPHTGRGYTIGLTGAPGAGKSSLDFQHDSHTNEPAQRGPS